MVSFDFLIQLYSCVQWYFYQAMTRGGQYHRKNCRGVTTDLGAGISKNVTNAGSQLSRASLTEVQNRKGAESSQVTTDLLDVKIGKFWKI